MTYASELAAISRKPITLVVITLDYCTRTFGTSPCLATGTKCYNTRPTCVFTSAYQSTTKTYRFTSHDVPAPWNDGERPYLMSVNLLPTEIGDVRTLVTRAKLVLADEPDNDVGIDPYVSSRSSVQGTYWKKWLARNPNFKGRSLTVWQGFAGLPEANFVQKFKGKIESIEFARDRVLIEASDLTADLGELYWPPKVDVKLTFAVGTSDVDINVTDASQLAAATGYMRIDDEVIKYTTRNTTTNQLSGLTRGMFGTVNVAHTVGKKVTRVGYSTENFTSNFIGIVLNEAGVNSNDYDGAGLVGIWNTPNFSPPKHELVVVEPRKVSDLLAELAELAEIYYWVGEDTKMQFVRRLPNAAGRTFAAALTDEANIVEGSVSVDLADDKRITRIDFWWDHDCINPSSERTSFNRGDIVVDAEAEVMYGESVPRAIYSITMRYNTVTVDPIVNAQNVANLIKRMVLFNNTARAIISLRVELKNADIQTGDYVTLTTQQLQDINGNGWSNVQCQVIKRDPPDAGMVGLTLRMLPPRKIGFIAPNTTPEWASATAADKQYAFLSNNAPNAGIMDEFNTLGYYIV